MNLLQLVPALHQGDAIGNNVRALNAHFKNLGLESHIFVLESDADIAPETLPLSEFHKYADNNSTVILHYALPSILSSLFAQSPGKKILVYHNITPIEFLRGYPAYQRLADLGRQQLMSLKDTINLAVADSEYNRQELEVLGFHPTVTIPIFTDFSYFAKPSNPVLNKMFDDDFINLIYVGRITPNKCQHDVIRLYGFFKKYVRERSRLFLVGKYDGFENYYYQLLKFGTELKLGDLYITGRVDTAELTSYYRMSHIFISMSEHEGFGVPLIESMYLGIPVMAFKAAAVPHTLGDSGVLFSEKKNWRELSELAGMIAKDSALNKSIKQKQYDRFYGNYAPERVAHHWNRIIRN